MDKERLQEVKEIYMELITTMMKGDGKLYPNITLLGTHKNEPSKNAMIQIPLGGFMKSSETKEEFVEKVIPIIAERVNEDFDIECVAWSAEAWLRRADSKVDLNSSEWKDLPKKEILFMSLETATSSEIVVMDIVRNGYAVDDSGELKEDIQLVPVPEEEQVPADSPMGGRFSNLYQKFVRPKE